MSVGLASSNAPVARGDDLVVSGVRNPASRGVARYASLLAQALAHWQIAYQLDARAPRRLPAHFHLANSSRALLLQGPARRMPFVVTVHDVVPRTRALLPLYRALAYPQTARPDAAVIVHTRFAADLLVREAGRRPARLELIPHPARQPPHQSRGVARRALGWPENELIAVLPGVIKPVKLARLALAAMSASPHWRLALVGRLADGDVARAAREAGMHVLASPTDADYERAIVAADCVLCLRSGSVGETNGPLLDALGAGRAVVATRTGTIPEIGGDAVHYCDAEVGAVAAALADVSDPSARAQLEAVAARRGAALSWEASAEAHAALFREVFGA